MNFTIKILGTGSAIPLKGKHQSAQLLCVNTQSYLIDCGEGTQYRMIESKINLHKIEAIFISHLHGDHFFGLVGLLSTMSLLGRTNPIKIIAPPGLAEIITMNFKVSGTVLAMQVSVFELSGKNKYLVFEDTSLTVHAFPLKHGVTTYGFLFEEKPRPRKLVKQKIPKEMLIEEMLQLKGGQNVYESNGELKYALEDYTYPPKRNRTYAYCSDTMFYEDIVENIIEADLLYHEATYTEEHREKANRNRHSTAMEAATIAKKANVKGLILGHLSSRYEDFNKHVEEANTIFTPTFAAVEGKTFSV